VARQIVAADLDLFAVIRLDPPVPLYRDAPDYPTIDHVILLQQKEGIHLGHLLAVREGRIVWKSIVCAGPPEENIDRFGPYRVILKGPAYH
jgi:hypothetical protein